MLQHGLELHAVRPVDVIPDDDGERGTHLHLAPRDKWVPSLAALCSPAWEAPSPCLARGLSLGVPLPPLLELGPQGQA